MDTCIPRARGPRPRYLEQHMPTVCHTAAHIILHIHRIHRIPPLPIPTPHQSSRKELVLPQGANPFPELCIQEDLYPQPPRPYFIPPAGSQVIHRITQRIHTLNILIRLHSLKAISPTRPQCRSLRRLYNRTISNTDAFDSFLLYSYITY